MSEDRPRYYSAPKRGGRVFWAPGKFAAAYGLPKSIPLGLDGVEAKKLAIDWNAKLDAARKTKREGLELAKPYPPGSLGSFYEKFRQSEAWGLMAPGTRAMYQRAWPTIDARFGMILVTKLTPDASERFHVDLHPQHVNKRDPKGELKRPWHQAHLVLKHWRLLLSALVSYKVISPPTPVGRVSNPSPPARTAVWIDPEILELIAKAREIEEHGMAVAIRIAWDTMMSTVDVRLLPISGWQSGRWADDEAVYMAGVIATRRKKSGTMVRVATTPEMDEAIAAYLRDHHPNPGGPAAPLLLRGTGRPFKDRHAFKQVFANVREAAFPGDARVFGDMRRSGATEAKLGGVKNEDLAPSMANRLDRDEGLQSTYIVAASENVLQARRAGRTKMTAKFRNGKK